MRLTVAVIVTLGLWASSFSAIKQSLLAYSPLDLAAGRFIFASATLAAFAVFKRIRVPAFADLPTLILAGLFGITGYHAALNFGQRTVSAGAASFVVNTVPLFTTMLAAIFLKERPARGSVVGLVVSFCGVAIITFSENQTVGINVGALLILLAALFASIYIILQKPLFKTYTVFEVVCYTMWAGTLGLLILAPTAPSEIFRAPLKPTVCLIYLGIFPGAIAGICWSEIVARVPTSQAVSYLYMIPALAVVVAWVWLRELPKIGSLVGGMVVIAGVALVNHAKFRAAMKSPDASSDNVRGLEAEPD